MNPREIKNTVKIFKRCNKIRAKMNRNKRVSDKDQAWYDQHAPKIAEFWDAGTRSFDLQAFQDSDGYCPSPAGSLLGGIFAILSD